MDTEYTYIIKKPHLSQKLRNRIYYYQNREKVLEERKIYLENNKDILKIKKNIYYHDNRERILAYHKKRYHDKYKLFKNI